MATITNPTTPRWRAGSPCGGLGWRSHGRFRPRNPPVQKVPAGPYHAGQPTAYPGDDPPMSQHNQAFLADCERIHRLWHFCASTRDTEGLLALYAGDATLESPLVPAILEDMPNGILRGRDALRRFFTEGAARRPNDLVRWYRTGDWLTDGRRLLVWEYPRETPDGDQVDLVEVIEIEHSLIQHHRIYWGWTGCTLIAPALARRNQD